MKRIILFTALSFGATASEPTKAQRIDAIESALGYSMIQIGFAQNELNEVQERLKHHIEELNKLKEKEEK